MFVTGHIATSYIISKLPVLWGEPQVSVNTWLFITSGSIVDLDLIYSGITGKKGELHHSFFTHTPLFLLGIWFIILALYNFEFSFLLSIFLLFNMILHLVLDNVGFWFTKLGWENSSKYPQINWGYPITKFHTKYVRDANFQYILKTYFTKAKTTVFLELSLVIIAFFLYILNI